MRSSEMANVRSKNPTTNAPPRQQEARYKERGEREEPVPTAIPRVHPLNAHIFGKPMDYVSRAISVRDRRRDGSPRRRGRSRAAAWGGEGGGWKTKQLRRCKREANKTTGQRGRKTLFYYETSLVLLKEAILDANHVLEEAKVVAGRLKSYVDAREKPTSTKIVSSIPSPVIPLLLNIMT
uniref:Histone domain-containing protein n=1 Tax=Steinernema glaseri TaxID=37863 RepID=A0A1I7ZNQ5_9BILA